MIKLSGQSTKLPEQGYADDDADHDDLFLQNG